VKEARALWSERLFALNGYQHRVEQLDRAAAEKVAGMLFGARKKLAAY
jgi:hypothetical protein